MEQCALLSLTSLSSNSVVNHMLYADKHFPCKRNVLFSCFLLTCSCVWVCACVCVHARVSVCVCIDLLACAFWTICRSLSGCWDRVLPSLKFTVSSGAAGLSAPGIFLSPPCSTGVSGDHHYVQPFNMGFGNQTWGPRLYSSHFSRWAVSQAHLLLLDAYTEVW